MLNVKTEHVAPEGTNTGIFQHSCQGLFTRNIFQSVSVITVAEVLHCANGDSVNNGQNWWWTHSVHYSYGNMNNNAHGLKTLPVNRPLGNGGCDI